MPFGNPSTITYLVQELPDLDGGDPWSQFDDVDGGAPSTTWWDATYDGGGVL